MTTPWWDAARHADRRPLLLARNAVKTALRAWFLEQGFIEVEAGQIQVSPGNEAHLHALAVALRRPDGATEARYLHTSPEFALKKLLAAGERAIFDFARVFRDRERGPLHAPEFTMLEWYRAQAPYDAVMADCAALVARAAEAAGTRRFVYRGREADPFAAPERLTVAEAFARDAGVDLLATLDEHGRPDRDALARQAAAAGVAPPPDDGWPDLFSKLLVARIEPQLGVGRPTLLCQYPLCEAALARPCAHDPRLAERFELYACGVELANGFGELTNPAEQRARFETEMAEKQRVHGERYPLDEDFLAALAAMPEASGVALGFDRLVMLAAGAPRIEDVLWTPLAQGGA